MILTGYTIWHGKQIKQAFSQALKDADLLTANHLKSLSDIAIEVAKKDKVSFHWFFENDTNLPGYCKSMIKYLKLDLAD